MDALLDILWIYLANGFQFLGKSMFAFLQNFHFMGPTVLIALLAMGTVCFTKLLNRVITTRRYVQLEKEFHHWLKIREEAMKYKDREKGKRLARNIDQAELNRAYYDYFFEGLLLNIARKIIPILLVFAFINEYFQTSNMISLFGNAYVFEFMTSSGKQVIVGAPFFYLCSLVVSYLLWYLVGQFHLLPSKQQKKSSQEVIKENGHEPRFH